MDDLSQSSDSDLVKLTQAIKAEQKRREQILSLQQEAKDAAEKITLAVDGLQGYGVGSRFELLRGLMP